MSNGYNVPREAAPGPDDIGSQSLRYAGEQAASAAPAVFCRSGQDGDRDAESGLMPVLSQPASNAPRRSLFRR